MSGQGDLALAALDVACAGGALMLFLRWRRGRARPPLVGAIALLLVAGAASLMVLTGIPERTATGPAFILALFVVLYTARFDRPNRG